MGDLNNKVIDNKNYYGYTAAVGVGTPGVEGHGEMSYTITLAEVNIFEWLLETIYINEGKE